MVKFTKIFYNHSRYLHKFSSLIDISKSVLEGLVEKKPIVALETTIVTHGMPYPQNKETALEVEELIMQQGAIPATIGIINGRIKIGLDKEMLSLLAYPDTKKIKVSRCDFPFVLSEGLNGGTTVSGTLLVAKMAGIDIFVTGGIGGVHRDVNDSMDISADLLELSRSPVMVVSSGIKSILDIRRTLEYLETCGVCVVTYSNTKEFPAFYSKKSGFQSMYNTPNAKSAANLIFNLKKMRSESGILLGVPIPEEFSLEETKIEEIINDALKIAKKNEISGKSVTPFVLEYIGKNTKGKSLISNMGLIKNNAVVGAQIGVYLNQKQKYTESNTSFGQIKNHSIPQKIEKTESNLRFLNNIIIIGGAVLDVFMYRNSCNIEVDDSNKITAGNVVLSPGGVARNIADAIGRLQSNNPPYFIGAIGNDSAGTLLWNSLEHVNRDGILLTKNCKTACCAIEIEGLHGPTFAVNDMDIHKLITPKMIYEHEGIISKSSVLIFDANIPLETMKAILVLCMKHEITVWFEPTDWNIVTKPFTLNLKNAITYISPNFKELRLLSQYLTGKTYESDSLYRNLNTLLENARDYALQVLPFVPNIVVTLGKYGVLMVKKNSNNPEIMFYESTEQHNKENVFGVGDCMASGYIVAMQNGLPVEQCISVGMNTALQSVISPQTIPETLSYGFLTKSPQMFELPLTDNCEHITTQTFRQPGIFNDGYF